MKIHCKFDKEMAVGELVPHPLNPNVHTSDQIKKLARVIKFFGWRKCVTVSNLSHYIIRGHARYAAALECGLKTVPVNFQDYANNDDELADLVADNRISELSEMGEGAAFQIMSALNEVGFDLDLMGFDIDDFKKRGGVVPGLDVFDNRPDDFVQLNMLFLKRDVTWIMKVLNSYGNPAAALVKICRNEKPIKRSEFE